VLYPVELRALLKQVLIAPNVYRFRPVLGSVQT
jgi:hypothetical protein